MLFSCKSSLFDNKLELHHDDIRCKLILLWMKSLYKSLFHNICGKIVLGEVQLKINIVWRVFLAINPSLLNYLTAKKRTSSDWKSKWVVDYSLWVGKCIWPFPSFDVNIPCISLFVWYFAIAYAGRLSI